MYPENEEEKESNEGGMLRWLITYADMITLLLAFFIILYALNRTQQFKMMLVAQALANKFNSKSIVGSSPGPSVVTGSSGTRAQNSVELESLRRLQHELQQAVDRAGLQNAVSIQLDFRGVVMSLSATLLFPSGSAALTSRGVGLLRVVGKTLLSVPNSVVVSGYTDSRPIHTSEFPSNWQLSAMRAANVVSTMAKVPGLAPRLSIAAYGKYHPIATNRTPQGMMKNRRVTILVERMTFPPQTRGNPSQGGN